MEIHSLLLDGVMNGHLFKTIDHLKLLILGKTEVSPTSTKKLKVSIDVYANQKCQQVYAQSQVTILDEQVKINFYFALKFYQTLMTFSFVREGIQVSVLEVLSVETGLV